MVMVRLGRSSASQCEFTTAYQCRRPNQNPSVLACVFPYQSLPESLLAVRIALVLLVWSGILYHDLPFLRSGIGPAVSILYQSLPPHRRRRGTGNRCECSGQRGWVGQLGEGYVGLEWWHTIQSGTHHRGGYRKEKSFSEWSWSHSIL